MKKTIPIGDATEDQLRLFMAEQGISSHANAKAPALLGRIEQSGYTKPTIEIEEDTAPADLPTTVADSADPDEVAEPWYTILIAEEEKAGGTDPVAVNPNGRNMFIPRGEECKVKHRYYHALMNAVQTVYEQPDGPMGEMVPRKVLSYPVSVIHAPPQADLDAWSKYKADKQTAEVEEKKKRQVFVAA